MNRRGFTLIELVIVIVIMGAMAAFAFPRIGDGITRQNVRSARTLFVATLAKTRAVAIQRGVEADLVLNNNQLTIRSLNPVSRAWEQVGNVENLTGRYGVTVTANGGSSATVPFDGRGMRQDAATTSVTIRKSAYGTTFTIGPTGRVQ